MGLFTFLFSCGQDSKEDHKSVYPEEVHNGLQTQVNKKVGSKRFCI